MEECLPKNYAFSNSRAGSSHSHNSQGEDFCAVCDIRELSICGTLESNEFGELLNILTRRQSKNKDILISEGEVAYSVFNVTHGAIKLYKLMPDGRRQITGFLLEGDFMGLATQVVYPYSAEAIGEVNTCEFDRKKLKDLFEKYPKLEHRLLRMASDELAQAQDQMLLLGRKTSREKLCSFLMSLSQRKADQGKDPLTVFIPMSRSDIADYLGLTTETVSRTFSALKRSGLIRLIQGNYVEINEPDRLKAIAAGVKQLA